ncbi:hypothetical protein Mapa_017708 [Marchantia paleacea]|nr:hypothetical protein Mapa_017708 [Marchantia paleacea]
MSSSPEASEFRCFVGGLSWSTTDRGLEDAFRPYSSVLDAKVMVDRGTGRSRGFGFVTFGDERSMDQAIHRLHGKDLDGRPITVDKAQRKSRGGTDRYRAGSGGRGGGECFKCGQPWHWARECHSGSGGGGGAGSGSRYYRGDRYGSGSKVDPYGGVDRYRSGGGGGYGSSRSSGLDRYTGSDRFGAPDGYRNGQGYGA